MIVVDASALFHVIYRGSVGAALEARLFSSPQPICAPHLLDAEIASVIRKQVLIGKIGEIRAREALQDFLDLSLVRFPQTNLLARAFALRHTMTAYDALYVALAESLGAPLITCDRRLAKAATGTVAVEAF